MVFSHFLSNVVTNSDQDADKQRLTQPPIVNYQFIKIEDRQPDDHAKLDQLINETKKKIDENVKKLSEIESLKAQLIKNLSSFKKKNRPKNGLNLIKNLSKRKDLKLKSRYKAILKDMLMNNQNNAFFTIDKKMLKNTLKNEIRSKLKLIPL